ncbi:MAG: tyrosine-type recombinase/integrase [Weeksellaceae bacterium]|nr:tyrosine-type recombinase/integrase [Weeksellaceae bacterium]
MWVGQFKDYLMGEKRCSMHTVNAYSRDVVEFQAFVQSHTQASLDTIGKKEVRMFIAHQLSQKSNRSVNRKLSSVRAFYRFLQKTETLDYNPLDSVKSLKVEKKVIIPLSQKEGSKILYDTRNYYPTIEHRNKLMIEILYHTGIRRSELITLQKKYFDFHKREIKVLGKRNKQRVIPLNSELAQKISDYISMDLENSGDYIFAGKSGAPLNPKTVYTIVKKELSAYTEKENKGPHVLRHSLATHMLQNGAEINSVKEILGHSSLAATEVYTHLDLKKLTGLIAETHPREVKNQKT